MPTFHLLSMNSSAHLGFDFYINLHFRLFFAKMGKIAYACNGKDTPNIQIGITSFLYKISTQILRVAYGSVFGSEISNMLSKFQGSQGSWHGNQI